MKRIMVVALVTVILLGMTNPVKHIPSKYYYFCIARPTNWNTSEKKMIAYTDIKEGIFDKETRDLTIARAWGKLVNTATIGFGSDTIPPTGQSKVTYTSDVNFYETPEAAQKQLANFLKAFSADKYTIKKLELK